MILFKYVLVSLALALASCGDNNSNDDKKNQSPPRPEQPPEGGDQDGKPTYGDSQIPDGKYFLTAAQVEAFDSAGNKLDPQNLQITGDYYWVMKSLAAARYEVTASGAVKISNTNQVLAEVNCRGAQDVYIFDVTDSGALRNLQITETGCPQSLQEESAQQNSIQKLSDTSFTYTVVNQNQGARVIETYTFKKM